MVEAIISHPGVRDAAIYGVRDRDGGEHLHAAIECDPDVAVEMSDDYRCHIPQLPWHSGNDYSWGLVATAAQWVDQVIESVPSRVSVACRFWSA